MRLMFTNLDNQVVTRKVVGAERHQSVTALEFEDGNAAVINTNDWEWLRAEYPEAADVQGFLIATSNRRGRPPLIHGWFTRVADESSPRLDIGALLVEQAELADPRHTPDV